MNHSDVAQHFAHQVSRCYYNGLKHEDVPSSEDNGIHHWNDRGGIVGRGILLDYVRYAEKKGIKYDVMKRNAIGVDVLEDIAMEQGTQFKPAEVLIVRTGMTKWYNTASQAERDQKIMGGREANLEWTGVEGSMKTVEWLWNHHFAAFAGDCISFEVNVQWLFTYIG